MKYKGILLDLDNTLYDYHIAHSAAQDGVFQYMAEKFSMTEQKVFKAYNFGRKKTHTQLREVAASHNRLLYFQYMLEHLGINPLNEGLELYEVYWARFIDNIKIYDGVQDLLDQYKNRICIVTDLTTRIQYRKCKKLGLNSHINSIVTSEEAGHEKPHPFIFLLALQKLGLTADQVCMIGDNFDKDILGALNLNMQSIWFNKTDKKALDHSLVTQVSRFNDILELV